MARHPRRRARARRATRIDGGNDSSKADDTNNDTEIVVEALSADVAALLGTRSSQFALEDTHVLEDPHQNTEKGLMDVEQDQNINNNDDDIDNDVDNDDIGTDIVKDNNDITMDNNTGNKDANAHAREIRARHYSARHRLRMRRLTVAQLKACTSVPELVEWEDCTAMDPLTLLHLKQLHNAVPVPPNWSQKRKYLQGKRGIHKEPFDLPDFIKATGIMGVRDTDNDDTEDATLKARTRERVQPKLGRMELDYQKVHDAFFKFQTKPKLTLIGDVYYEGKESDQRVDVLRLGLTPGQLSDELRAALDMHSPLSPPPWLASMQRLGPPPAYPTLKVPGVNAPLPVGAKWGFQPDGWGKPPVDSTGKPLYGDVFGIGQDPLETMRRHQLNEQLIQYANPQDRTIFGAIEEDDDDETDNDDDDDDDDDNDEDDGVNKVMG